MAEQISDTPLWEGYSSIDVLPLLIFIDCLLEQQFEKLIVEGPTVTDENREAFETWAGDHWLKHYSEFHARSGNDSMSSIVMQIWQRETTLARYRVVKNMLAVYSMRPDETIARAIRLFGFGLPLFNGDIEAHAAHVNRIAAQLKGLEKDARNLQAILDSLKADNPGKEMFTRQLNAISRHNKFHVSIKEITAGEYCEYLRAYREYADSVNNPTHATAD